MLLCLCLHVFASMFTFAPPVRFPMWELGVTQTEFPYAIYELLFKKQICYESRVRTHPKRLKKRPSSLPVSSETSLWGALVVSLRQKIQCGTPKVVQKWFVSVPTRHFWNQNEAKFYYKMKTKTRCEKIFQNIQTCFQISSKMCSKMNLESKGLKHATIADFWWMYRTKY